jgi:hypothetical protein
MKKEIRLLLMVLTFTASGNALAAWPPSQCTHVQVLGAEDTDQISWEHDGGILSDNSRLMDARPNQLDALGEALDMMPEVLCKAVQKVAFIYRAPEEGKNTVVDAWTKSNDRQNLVYLNTWDDLYWNQNNIDRTPSFRAAAIQRMIHETTHCAIRMLQSQQKAKPVGLLQQRPEASLWPAGAHTLARNVIKNNRLEMGLLREWQRMHSAFVAAGMSTAYWDKEWSKMKNSMTAEQLTSAGLTSAYGGKNAMEDIAELTSWAIVRGTAVDPEDAACRVMNRRSGSGIQSADAAIFTKLGFVRTLGFITEQQYQDCVGNLKIDVLSDGFYSYRNSTMSRSYTGNANAGAGRFDEGEQFIFSLEADGSAGTSSDANVPVSMLLLLDITPPLDEPTFEDLSYPRGIYLIGFRHSKFNRLQIKKKEDGGLLMDVGQGVALVGLASSDGIVGSVAVQRIFNYAGGLMSSIAGDEPVKDPTRITFRYDPGQDE